MNLIQRPYSEEAGDFHRLCSFVIAHQPYLRTHSTWCLGRIVDWKYGLYGKKRSYASFCNENAHLWFDGFGELAGFVLSEGGERDFAIFTLPGYRFLYAEILEWVLATWSNRGPGLKTETTDRQVLEIKFLEGFGFRSTCEFFTRRFDLTGELAPRLLLEPGFTLVDMYSHPDYRAQGILRADAFEGKNLISEEELAERLKFYNYNHSGPIYHPQTDICVMAPGGQLVAGCEALIDAHNLEADIERVCTHSSFRQRGFARAAIQECLYRLKDMSLQNAYITGYSPTALALYGSLGATDELKRFVYEQPPVSD